MKHPERIYQGSNASARLFDVYVEGILTAEALKHRQIRHGKKEQHQRSSKWMIM